MSKRKTKQPIARRVSRLKKIAKRSKLISRKPYKRIRKSGFLIKRPRVSDARIERGLRILSDTGDISTAARSVRLSPKTFRQAAKRKGAIRKRKGRWTVGTALPRQMPIFTDGKQLAITVRSKTASIIGRHNSAVGQFARTNNPGVLAEFKDRTVKDVRGKSYALETDPNALYRLLSAAEPFEEIYRIII